MTDYAATMRDFRLEVPARFNWAFDTFDAWARDPSKLALLWVSADGQPRRFSNSLRASRNASSTSAAQAIALPDRRPARVLRPNSAAARPGERGRLPARRRIPAV